MAGIEYLGTVPLSVHRYDSPPGVNDCYSAKVSLILMDVIGRGQRTVHRGARMLDFSR